MDPIEVTHVASREGLSGALRGVAAIGGAVLIAWHSPEVAKYALGVVALVASPALARAVLAPRIARMLRSD